MAPDGRPKVLACTAVSNSLGTITPLARLVGWAHDQGAIAVVDAAQAAPHTAVDVQAIGADFVAFTGHKICGPTGIGALWGRAELLESMSPFELGGHMIRKVTVEKTTWNELPHKFEAGTAPIAEAVGLAAAIDYVTDVGLSAIERHEHELTEYALGRLGEIPRTRASTGRPPTAASASSRSTSRASTRTTSPRSWTPRASPSAPVTTATSR